MAKQWHHHTPFEALKPGQFWGFWLRDVWGVDALGCHGVWWVNERDSALLVPLFYAPGVRGSEKALRCSAV